VTKPLPFDPARLLTVAEMQARADAEPRGWLIDRILPAAGTVVFAGKSRAGKTSVLCGMAVSVAAGRSFAGLTVCQRTVAIMYFEHGQDDLMQKLRAVCAGMHVRLEDLPIVQVAAHRGHWRSGGDDLRRRVVANLAAANVGLVIVDSLRRFHPYRDSATDEMAEAAAHLEDLTSHHSRTVVATHHLNAGGGLLGADAFQAATDVVVKVARKETMVTLNVEPHAFPEVVHVLQCVATPDGSERHYEPENSASVTAAESSPALSSPAVFTPLDMQVRAFIRDHPDCTQNAIEENVDGKATAIRASIAKLVQQGHAAVIKKGRSQLHRATGPPDLR
jgi:hypothetical protein